MRVSDRGMAIRVAIFVPLVKALRCFFVLPRDRWATNLGEGRSRLMQYVLFLNTQLTVCQKEGQTSACTATPVTSVSLEIHHVGSAMWLGSASPVWRAAVRSTHTISTSADSPWCSTESSAG